PTRGSRGRPSGRHPLRPPRECRPPAVGKSARPFANTIRGAPQSRRDSLEAMMHSRVTAHRIAELLGADVHGPDIAVVGLAPLGEAERGQFTFANDRVKSSAAVERALRSGAVVLLSESSDEDAA